MITRKQQEEYKDKCYGCSKELRDPDSPILVFKENVYIIKKFDSKQIFSKSTIKFCEPCWQDLCGSLYELQSENVYEIEELMVDEDYTKERT